MKNRVIEQMLEHVLPTDIEDERPARPYATDIGEVLLGSNTHINPTSRFQSLDDLRIGGFVGYEIVRIKIASGLRKISNELRETRCRSRFGNASAGTTEAQSPPEKEKPRQYGRVTREKAGSTRNGTETHALALWKKHDQNGPRLYIIFLLMP